MHPILFEIGPITVRAYGVLVALAFFVGFYLLYKEAKRNNFYPDKVPDMALMILIFGVMGARLLHVLVNFDYYKSHIAEVVLIWQGGLAIYGAILFVIIGGWLFIIKNRMPFFRTADFFVPYAALGQSIGRIGCFFNGCCYGKPGHPAQLYASTALIGIFIILKLAEKKRHGAGFIFGLYLVLYSAQRFSIDFFRADLARFIFGLTVSQFISIAVFFAGFALLARWKN